MDGLKREIQSVRIPVLDIGRASTAERLVEAVAQFGFVFVKGEGLGFTVGILDEAFALVRPDRSV